MYKVREAVYNHIYPLSCAGINKCLLKERKEEGRKEEEEEGSEEL